MLKEVDYFMNDAGRAIIYEESRGGYTIERQITTIPGLYRCRIYYAADIVGARKRFNQIKGILSAIQTWREKKR